MATPPELTKILQQVQAELSALVEGGKTGTVTVHCGKDDLYVEAVTKRRYDTVSIGQERRLALIRKAR